MNRKAAFFVEGQTEQIFIKKLLEEIGGVNSISFKEQKLHSKQYITLTHARSPKPKYFILIVDCARDEHVKSAILEQRSNLINSGYELIVGLKDLHPKKRSEKARVLKGLAYGVPTNDINIELRLSIMEIEAWFLQEYSHFERIEPTLSLEFIKMHFNFEPDTKSTESIDEPAKLLHNIYQLAGKGYKKKKSQVARTVRSLDYEKLYCSSIKRNKSLSSFIGVINDFFSR